MTRTLYAIATERCDGQIPDHQTNTVGATSRPRCEDTVSHVAQALPSDPWFRTRSPEEAIHLCETAFYPHRLSVLGPSNSFGLSLSVTQMGPITLGDITYDTDVALSFDEPRANYHVHVPLRGWLKSRHRGQQLTSTPAVATNYRPDAEVTVTHWPGGSRQLAVSRYGGVPRSAVKHADRHRGWPDGRKIQRISRWG